MKRVLLVSSANPFPVVRNGCERLVLDYLQFVFRDAEALFVATRPGTWEPIGWYREDGREGPVDIEMLLSSGFHYAFFVGFRENAFTRAVTARVPSFCLTDRYPHPDVPDGVFRGILSHHATEARPDILLCGGSYNSDIFYKHRTGDDIVVSVARVHPEKNLLELVEGYRRRIYDRTGLPLWLIGGVDDPAYFARLRPHIDGTSICSTVDDTGSGGWLPAAEIAALLNRARFFVTASPRESFGIALAEAMACGATCVLNGDFPGFDPRELAPRVVGNVTAKQGSILDVLEEAVRRDARRDASEWVRKYSVACSAQRQVQFIERRLREQ